MVFDINGNPLISIKETPITSISMFETMGIIGDSFASGEIYERAGATGVDYYSLSWGQVLARITGISATNYSEGGLTTQTWLSDADHGLPKLNTDPVKNLYIIALGINDTNRLTPSKLGTIADITSDNTDSFYSYYGRIIRGVVAHAPNAVIMLSTLARFGGDYDLFSNAVKAIGNYYNYPVFDLSQSDFFQSSFFSTNQISNHPVAVNYSAMAKEYKRFVENELQTNPSRYAGYVG